MYIPMQVDFYVRMQTNKYLLNTHVHTNPSIASVLSISVSSFRLDAATDFNASSGHSENQSIVQQVTKLGNCLNLDLNTSPMGL